MSRARPFYIQNKDQTIWFDQSSRATVKQLELLSDYESVDVDDLLDEALTQKQVLFRLRLATKSHVIPAKVLERKRQRALIAEHGPRCRICTPEDAQCEGPLTRHHFVPRWLMRELDNYTAYATRTNCTIPICIGRHRDLHYRGDGTPKSIVPYLRQTERLFAHKLLNELKEQRPRIYDLLLAGEEDQVYEAQLIYDHAKDNFVSPHIVAYELPEYAFASVAQSG